ncbi:DarT ssDNA thymidine ADP-ribosyltransferase family protein [Kyrpidia tusciae]|uniref:Appr-1-p processing domain protein n=1 Tax=Kyrpidia tusciae (strain DSM 2912 / NBRC 15312 / T2) TaxID=562970 RepID=D5WX77_KYRT2|nr:DarT ssDNA thymidine ADP-ribosyltransferase family protein [Kyrpidia tusciae]ADG07858.1 Appr-1-p processing domain protein [Kyrpidia tusciae DSM 2912]
MLRYVATDLFQSPAQVLVNTVNTVGVMGKGVAKEFASIYPDMYTKYRALCERHLFDIGQLWLYKTSHKWILNFPTKRHWRSLSKVEYIEAGLKKFVDTYAQKGITSISFPLLGCGNGGLDFDSQVQPVMEKYLQPLPIDVFVHLTQKFNKSEAEHLKPAEMKRWLRSNPSILSLTGIYLPRHLDDVGTKLGPNRWWTKYLFHFTDVKNAAQILSSGSLLSRNEAMAQGMMLNDNASPEVLAQTDERWKDYVRFYFRPKTPTQYRNEGFLPPDERYLRAHCPVPIFFLFDAVSLLSLPECAFSDITLASPNATTFTHVEDFKRLKFDYIYHEGPYDKSRPNIANYRQAEVVVPIQGFEVGSLMVN